MFTVSDIEADVKRVLGGADDATFYSALNHAVEILSTESEWDPLFGYVDVCVGCDRYATLPREVGTVLAATIDGTPAQGHDWLFKFHLNGPGPRFQPVGYHWVDSRPVATQLDPPPTALKLVTGLETADDNDKEIRVFGYDVNNEWIRSTEGDSIVDGFLVPTTYGSHIPSVTAPAVKRITRISKATTAGTIKLYTIDDDDVLTKIAEYAPDETEPRYRRIQVSKKCAWVRIAFRKGEVKLSSGNDLIPLHSKYALVSMAKALKKLDEDRPEEYEKYKKIAVDLLVKKQESLEVPGGPSFQIADQNLLADKSDRLE